MIQPDNERIDQELSKLLSEIKKWKNQAARYRRWNDIQFACFKVLVPLGSLAVAASTFSQLQGQTLFSPITTLILAGLVVVLSGLDSILNPGARKRVGFKTSNALRELENRIGVEALRSGQEELIKLILQANSELKGILDDYADKGY